VQYDDQKHVDGVQPWRGIHRRDVRRPQSEVDHYPRRQQAGAHSKRVEQQKRDDDNQRI